MLRKGYWLSSVLIVLLDVAGYGMGNSAKCQEYRIEYKPTSPEWLTYLQIAFGPDQSTPIEPSHGPTFLIMRTNRGNGQSELVIQYLLLRKFLFGGGVSEAVIDELSMPTIAANHRGLGKALALNQA